jgi:hypothetical protein
MIGSILNPNNRIKCAWDKSMDSAEYNHSIRQETIKIFRETQVWYSAGYNYGIQLETPKYPEG